MRAETKRDLIARLRSADGHLHAVLGMLEADRDCDQILHQLNAVQAALRAVGGQLLQDEVQECIGTVRKSDCPEKSAIQLERLLHLYTFSLKSGRFDTDITR